MCRGYSRSRVLLRADASASCLDVPVQGDRSSARREEEEEEEEGRGKRDQGG